MQKVINILIIVLLTLSFVECKKSESEADENSNSLTKKKVSAEGKKFIGKWKASIPGYPGADQIWIFKPDGGFEWVWARQKYNGIFEVNEDKLIVTFPIKTTHYKIMESSENKIKLLTKAEGKQIITFLTKLN